MVLICNSTSARDRRRGKNLSTNKSPNCELPVNERRRNREEFKALAKQVKETRSGVRAFFRKLALETADH